MDVWEYFEQRERECVGLSLVPDEDLPNFYAELKDSGGRRGRVVARLILTERAFISASERVTVVDNHIHRDEYAYYLIIDGAEVFARERDPTHDPPEHGHGPGHAWEAAGPISFKAFAEQAWEISSQGWGGPEGE